jgi:hypothetical protein
MADGVGWVPIEAKVAACDGQVRRDGKFFVLFWLQQGTVITNAQVQSSPGHFCHPVAYPGEQRQFAWFGFRNQRLMPHSRL